MANVNVSNDEFNPQSGSDSKGRKETIVSGESKATANDTLTFTSATTVVSAILFDDTTGVLDPITISGNVVTLTGATTGTVSGRVIYR